MIAVESGVYIGSVSDLRDAQSLSDAGITHILTVDSEEAAVTGFHTRFVRALDDASTDLLSKLDDCISFIYDALNTQHESKPPAVLVHCHVGQSRSAAVVTAYLMKTQNLSLQDAYTKLQNLKPDVKMNEEFLDQLSLYELLDCKLDSTNPLYKQFRLKKITEKYPELQNVPKDIFAVDPAQTQNLEAVYRCRKCRRTLFRHSSILSHCVGGGASAFTHKKTRTVTPSAEDEKQCTSYFIEPVQWMEQALLGVMDGQLLCPKCSSKLGSFNWYGEQCSCGRWVTPAFQMHKNRLDEIKHINISALK
ncbi:dual specificity protein phosphatase 12 [Xyrauchen texanus]|uniref:dual specificity protein phosphatase 12 n=1 Tax=Xyrauchen texanus TaxID=154827 RepID=UPI002241E774|nr:dual specificity protein phosphatase 12 [Xyrauchen texanus]XP_051984061.1 dual specificity protein phosphatase 12 [Xyrauchen texanus]XP_051984062.1 dual specificity protein phosphatase 12 [Xyrauchen texanus]